MSEQRNRQQLVDAFNDDGTTALEEWRSAWDFGDLDGYIREGEPDQAARADYKSTGGQGDEQD